MRRWAAGIALASCLAAAPGACAAAPAEDDALEARTRRLSAGLRCLVCQNQSLADSHAALAVDLRNQVHEMLRAGRSEDEVVAFLTARYGDFVVYRPPLKASTALLWLGPGLLLALAAGVLVHTVRRRTTLHADAFDPEPPGDAT